MGTSPRGDLNLVQSELDVTDSVQNRLNVRGSAQSRKDAFVKWKSLTEQVGCKYMS